MDRIIKGEHHFIFWMLLIFVAFIYPMFVSIYVFLPLFIGTAGYMFVIGYERDRPSFSYLAIFYMLNMEINLSLPIFLILIASLLFYRLIYFRLLYVRNCSLCKPVLSVLFINLIYFGILLTYDFIFQTQSIVLDEILIYSLIVDMLTVVLL